MLLGVLFQNGLVTNHAVENELNAVLGHVVGIGITSSKDREYHSGLEDQPWKHHLISQGPNHPIVALAGFRG